MIRTGIWVMVFCLCAEITSGLCAAAQQKTDRQMPVREITIFKDGQRYGAQIVEVPARPLEIASPPPPARVSFNSFGSAGIPGNYGSSAPIADTVLLKTSDGVLALPFDQIKTITFTWHSLDTAL